jgi:hypothetical protein
MDILMRLGSRLHVVGEIVALAMLVKSCTTNGVCSGEPCDTGGAGGVTSVAGGGSGGVGAMSLMLVLLGVRGDLLAAMHLPMFWVKLALPVGIALGALTAAKRLARPGVVLGWLPAALLLAPVVGIGLLAACK